MNSVTMEELLKCLMTLHDLRLEMAARCKPRFFRRYSKRIPTDIRKEVAQHFRSLLDHLCAPEFYLAKQSLLRLATYTCDPDYPLRSAMLLMEELEANAADCILEWTHNKATNALTFNKMSQKMQDIMRIHEEKKSSETAEKGGTDAVD